MEKILRIISNTEYYKRMFLLNSMFYSFFFFTPKMGTVLTVFFSLWAAIILLHRLVTKKIDFRKKKLWCLFLFLIAFGISMIYNYRTAFVDNAKSFIITVILFFIIYFFEDEEQKKKEKNFKVYMRIVMWYSFIMSILTILLYFANVSLALYTDRYCGIYSNPIMSGLVGMCGMFVTLVLGLEWKKLKVRTRIFYVGQIILQFFIIALSNSRSAFICLLAFLLVFFVLLEINKKRGSVLKHGVIMILGIVIISLGTSWVYDLSKTGLFKVNSFIYELRYSVEESSGRKPSKNGFLEQLIPTDAYELERTMADESNNIRLNQILTGLQVFQKSPIVGVSPRNAISIAQEIAKENDMDITGIEGGGFHNSYIDILASLGIVGFLTACLFVVSILRVIADGMFRIKEKPMKYIQLAVLLAIIVSTCVVFLFESLMVFKITPSTIFFWLILGYLVSVSEDIISKSDY